MATRLDLDVDEGTTFTITIDFWENHDKTLPIDMTNHEFKGAFLLGQQYIEMSFNTFENSTTATIPFEELENVEALQGKYDIEARDTTNNEKYRVIEGSVRISKEVTKT